MQMLTLNPKPLLNNNLGGLEPELLNAQYMDYSPPSHILSTEGELYSQNYGTLLAMY